MPKFHESITSLTLNNFSLGHSARQQLTEDEYTLLSLPTADATTELFIPHMQPKLKIPAPVMVGTVKLSSILNREKEEVYSVYYYYRQGFFLTKNGKFQQWVKKSKALPNLIPLPIDSSA